MQPQWSNAINQGQIFQPIGSWLDIPRVRSAELETSGGAFLAPGGMLLPEKYCDLTEALAIRHAG